MRDLPRIVIDTSTLVSAALRPASTPAKALLKALGTGTLCASSETLQELRNVLGRDKFNAYLDREARMDFTGILERHVVRFDVPATTSVSPACRDVKDEKFLALAILAQATCIVTSDEDLLVLHPWNGIPILSPADFLREGTIL